MAVTVCYDPTCHARAIVVWLRDPDWLAAYCGHHSDAKAEGLVGREWVQVEDERDEWAGAEVDGPQTLAG